MSKYLIKILNLSRNERVVIGHNYNHTIINVRNNMSLSRKSLHLCAMADDVVENHY